MKLLSAVLFGIVLALAGTAELHARDWPTQTVRLVVPFSAGGPSDLTARVVAEEMSRQLPHAVIVDNRSGAGSVLGTGVVASAPPDGHTILFTTSSLGYMKSLVLELNFDPETDLVPVAVIGMTPYVLVTNNEFPAKSLADVVKLVRENPGKYNYGSAGVGSAMHFMFEHVMTTAGGLEVTHVPYRGGGAVITDLIGGQIQFATDPAPSALPHITKGAVRPIAVTSRSRLPALPDVPTFAESGLDEFQSFQAYGWYMTLVPAKTPTPLVAQINEAIRSAISSPEVAKRLAEMNVETPEDNSPESAARFLETQFKTWAEVAKRSGIVPQ